MIHRLAHSFFIKTLIALQVLLLTCCNTSTDSTVVQSKPATSPTVATLPTDSNTLKALRNLSATHTSGKAIESCYDSLSTNELQKLQHGDILLRRGYGFISEFIADFLGETYPVTHCGFVVRYPDNDSIFILHSMADDKNDGVFIQPLRAYLRESQLGSIAAVRLREPITMRQAIVNKAFTLIEKKIPFDMAFNDKDTTKLYCAEMMQFVFHRTIQKDLFPDRATKMGMDVVRMSNFFNKENFEVLFNHNPEPSTAKAHKG